MSRLRLFLPLIVVACIGCMFAGCDSDDDVWDEYKDWRIANEQFFEEQRFLIEDGTNVYQTLSPAWNTSAKVLIRYLNDRSKTVGNLSPMLTSTVDVKYIGRLYDGVAFDSSYRNVDSLSRFTPSQLIQGWTIALMDMRVGDSARIVIPYNLGYGSSNSGVIKPYSTLIFDLKLVDIPYYEVRP